MVEGGGGLEEGVGLIGYRLEVEQVGRDGDGGGGSSSGSYRLDWRMARSREVQVPVKVWWGRGGKG